MSIYRATKGLCRSPPWAKKFWGKNSQGCRRLLKAPKASWGRSKVPGAQGGSGGKGEWEEVRGWRKPGKQGPWVWLKTQGCWRCLKAPKASWGPRKVPGTQGGPRRLRGWEGVRGMWTGWGGPRLLSLTDDPRLPKACKGSQGLLRPQEGPKGSGRLRKQGGGRGWGEQGKQGLWVWLKTQGCQRLLKAPKACWGPRKFPGVQGGSDGKGSKGVRGAREARPLSLTEDQRLLKASEGSQGFLRPQEGPGGPERPREAQGARGGEREWGGEGEQGKHCPLSLTEDPSLTKACKGSQGFLRPQEGPRGWGRPREGKGQEGVRGSERKWGGAKEARPLSLTEDPRLPKASEGPQGFLRPQEGPRGPGRPREAQGVRGGEREWGEQEGARGARGEWEGRERGVRGSKSEQEGTRGARQMLY